MSAGPLAGRRALVTGASSGLGRHFALTLARAGASVAVAARREDRLSALVDEIGSSGGSAHAVALDVGDADQVRRAVGTVARLLGGIDVLVNNAGVTMMRPVLDVEEADWDRIVGTNLKGAWLVSQAVARVMTEAGAGGSIVNIASILAERVLRQVSLYAISKAGVVQMTKAMALELARHDIRVNALAPGYIETDLNRDFFASDAGKAMIRRLPQRRLGQPEDLDGALLLLAGDQSRYMTGSVITLDGGHGLALA